MHGLSTCPPAYLPPAGKQAREVFGAEIELGRVGGVFLFPFSFLTTLMKYLRDEMRSSYEHDDLLSTYTSQLIHTHRIEGAEEQRRAEERRRGRRGGRKRKGRWMICLVCLLCCAYGLLFVSIS
ncbi:hypothetical protein B0T19DRAFT_256886 [Cercophora scortea]|uniref:Uncharacterized protein n=1 Tax=Cercophora scortea TaxID=314031 RepID=A0AAE0IB53_9PEZI|nr:hypothetical protein B0T19DRAFT_256886 [Cercophora scortea]